LLSIAGASILKDVHILTGERGASQVTRVSRTLKQNKRKKWGWINTARNLVILRIPQKFTFQKVLIKRAKTRPDSGFGVIPGHFSTPSIFPRRAIRTNYASTGFKLNTTR